MAVDDIKIIWDTEFQEGDFVFNTADQDLEADNTLETAVIISLFSDRRAKIDDPLPDPNNLDRRGWWGDLVSFPVPGDQIGSRLWLLNREKTLEDVLARAKQYAQEALQWLVEDGVAVKIVIETERQGEEGNDRLAIRVEIYRTDGNKEAFNFGAQWDAQKLQIN